ncbi:hypothetical protein ACVSD9_24700 (plasmid) [Vibrio parahaemolyticus]
MPHIVQFHHPIREDDYTLHSVESGTCLSQWLSENLPAADKLKATCNFKELENFDHIIGEKDVVSIRPALGFGIDWVIWAALAVSVASAVYMYSQMPDLSSNADTQQASSVYNYNGQGNKPKLGNPVPVQYGRMPHYPDIIAPNWWSMWTTSSITTRPFQKGLVSSYFMSTTLVKRQSLRIILILKCGFTHRVKPLITLIILFGRQKKLVLQMVRVV